jgi:phospholipid-transporting ATPase
MAIPPIKKRFKQDREINCQTCLVLEETQFVERRWKDVIVGNILKVENNDKIPADIVVISTSLPEGICYIETSNLDG